MKDNNRSICFFSSGIEANMMETSSKTGENVGKQLSRDYVSMEELLYSGIVE